jgi:hypothetical protein
MTVVDAIHGVAGVSYFSMKQQVRKYSNNSEQPRRYALQILASRSMISIDGVLESRQQCTQSKMRKTREQLGR